MEKWDGEVKECWDELVSALKTSTEPGPAAAAGPDGAEGLRHLPSQAEIWGVSNFEICNTQKINLFSKPTPNPHLLQLLSCLALLKHFEPEFLV